MPQASARTPCPGKGSIRSSRRGLPNASFSPDCSTSSRQNTLLTTGYLLLLITIPNVCFIFPQNLLPSGQGNSVSKCSGQTLRTQPFPEVHTATLQTKSWRSSHTDRSLLPALGPHPVLSASLKHIITPCHVCSKSHNGSLSFHFFLETGSKVCSLS